MNKHYDLIIAWAGGHNIEMYSAEFDKWVAAATPTWNPNYQYRFTLSKPSINWDHVSPEYIALAVDRDGVAYLYKDTPYIKTADAWGSPTTCVNATAIASLIVGNYHWKDSSITRPIGYTSNDMGNQ